MIKVIDSKKVKKVLYLTSMGVCVAMICASINAKAEGFIDSDNYVPQEGDGDTLTDVVPEPDRKKPEPTPEPVPPQEVTPTPPEEPRPEPRQVPKTGNEITNFIYNYNVAGWLVGASLAGIAGVTYFNRKEEKEEVEEKEESRTR